MISIKLLKKSNIKGYTFIEGFPGAGLVGPMSISYIINKLKMKYIGYIEGDNFPPLVSIHNSTPMPLIRIYVSEEQKIVTAFAEFAIPIELVKELSNVLYNFIKDSGVSRIYSIGGIPQAQPAEIGEQQKPFGVASNAALSKDIAKAGMQQIVEGVSTGVGAILLIKSTLESFDNINVMIQVQPNMVDPIYAITAIDTLRKMMGLKIDTSDLDKEAKIIEAKIRDLANKHKEAHETYKKGVEDSGPSMYA